MIKNDITLTIEERNTILQAIQFNDGFIMPFGENSKTIKSLYKKGFAEKSDKLNHLYKITKNVVVLVEIEGVMAFDEILGHIE